MPGITECHANKQLLLGLPHYTNIRYKGISIFPKLFFNRISGKTRKNVAYKYAHHVMQVTLVIVQQYLVPGPLHGGKTHHIHVSNIYVVKSKLQKRINYPWWKKRTRHNWALYTVYIVLCVMHSNNYKLINIWTSDSYIITVKPVTNQDVYPNSFIYKIP